MYELQQAVGFGIFWTVFWHSSQNRFGMAAQDCELDVECTVKHGVGILLIGQNPSFFALADVFPLAYCLLCCERLFVVVADDASQQTVVASGHPVMAV